MKLITSFCLLALLSSSVMAEEINCRFMESDGSGQAVYFALGEEVTFQGVSASTQRDGDRVYFTIADKTEWFHIGETAGGITFRNGDYLLKCSSYIKLD